MYEAGDQAFAPKAGTHQTVLHQTYIPMAPGLVYLAGVSRNSFPANGNSRCSS
jgi:hypothetical protein